jgi:uncharacterized protein YndB with AHSA1/START domain
MEIKPGDYISIDFKIEAPLKKVWRAWTDPEVILQWFGSDPGDKGLDADLQVFPGGNYEVHFKSPDQTEHTAYGIYKEVVEFSKLSFTWNWKSEPGMESLVSLFLVSVGEQTLMHFEQHGFGYESAHNYAVGWKGTFVKLNKLLSKIEN